MGRAPCCDKANVKRGPWSPEEDAELKSYIEKHGTGGNWIALPQKIGLKRCGKSCRLRWLNYLRPNIKHGGFSEEEDRLICSLYISIGSRWSIIAAQLPGRTDNDIKNYWNTKLKKKLLGKPRKDQPCQRRVGNKNKAINEAFKVPGDGEVSPYWPPPVPEVYPTPVDWNALNDHGSIRKLLINISASQVCSNTPIGLVNSSSSSSATTTSSLGAQTSSSPVEAPEATNCFSTELDDMIYGNPLKLDGLDGLFGVENMVINGGSGNCGATSLEGLNWNGDNISPLVYPQLISNYNGVHQQCNILEEQARLGSHW